jgi:cytochrome P450 / NADPH-cytochrome P450 reductase
MDLQPIPGPRGLPILGNLLDLRDDEAPLRAIENLADMYGEIYKIKVGGKTQIIVSSAEMMKEVMDEKRFLKTAIPGLAERKPNGLIVAGTLDPDWEQAHRILRPVGQ